MNSEQAKCLEASQRPFLDREATIANIKRKYGW